MRKRNGKITFERFKSYLPLYFFVIPGIVLVILFNYIPILGLQLAFKNYSFRGGIWGSPWVGLDNFRVFIVLKDFWRIVMNTFLLTSLRLVFTFPAPIILA